MIYVIATVHVLEGQRDAFLKEFHQVMPLVLQEEGCLTYGPAVDVPTGLERQIPIRDSVVTIVETWETLDHLRAHLAAPHMNDYRQRVKHLVVSTQLQILNPV